MARKKASRITSTLGIGGGWIGGPGGAGQHGLWPERAVHLALEWMASGSANVSLMLRLTVTNNDSVLSPDRLPLTFDHCNISLQAQM